VSEELEGGRRARDIQKTVNQNSSDRVL
jgi:hypothetical protein